MVLKAGTAPPSIETHINEIHGAQSGSPSLLWNPKVVLRVRKSKPLVPVRSLTALIWGGG
jgi:hypothetical protein